MFLLHIMEPRPGVGGTRVKFVLGGSMSTIFTPKPMSTRWVDLGSGPYLKLISTVHIDPFQDCPLEDRFQMDGHGLQLHGQFAWHNIMYMGVITGEGTDVDTLSHHWCDTLRYVTQGWKKCLHCGIHEQCLHSRAHVHQMDGPGLWLRLSSDLPSK